MSRGSEVESECLTLRDAYVAMYYFVRAYWERGGRQDGSVTLFLNALGPTEDPEHHDVVQTTDPAFWEDWLAAVGRAMSNGLPKEL